MQDPIADMLTSIRNGQNANKDIVYIPNSKVKVAIVTLLKEEGFIQNYKILGNTNSIIKIILKYFNGKPVLENIQRISRPGCRVYKKKHALPKVMSGMGIAIISTSLGMITDSTARKLGIGGEIICYIA